MVLGHGRNGAKAIRLLLVEDSEANAALIREYLQKADAGSFELQHVLSLGGALRRLSLGGIDLVLLDLGLPDSDGIETVRKVHAAAPQLPIIVMTGHRTEWMVTQAIRDGAQDYLFKGEIVPSLLIRSIQYAIERQRAVAALQDSEERYRRIIETAEEGVWMIDAENKTTFVNQKMADLLGYTVGQMQGQLVYAFMDDDARKSAVEHMERRRGGMREQFDFRFRRKDGSELWALVVTSPIVDHAGRYTGVLAMVTDITERKELELRLQHSQKMDAIGRLAGGVAHDFNNLLTAIMGYSRILEVSLSAGSDPRLNDVREIIDASRRAASLTRQLLAFSRRQLLSATVLNINAIVSGMEKMLRRLIGEDLSLAVDLEPGLGNVKADGGQIEQVILNLAVNARDAMPDGGTISIVTRDVWLEKEIVGRHDIVPPGRYVMISVSDTGCGMDFDVLSHLFEPFFTTKERGKGTGLGLSTLYGIVKQSEGYIEISSEPGRGSTFKIYLPRTEAPAEPQPIDDLSITSVRGSETILLAEDDASVRRMLARVLSEHGYDVLAASNGKEAISLLERQGVDVDLLLTDIVMPEVGGRGLAEYVGSAFPGIKIIFMSGYTDDVVLRHGGRPGPDAVFLQKPVAAESLLRKLRQALGGPGRPFPLEVKEDLMPR